MREMVSRDPWFPCSGGAVEAVRDVRGDSPQHPIATLNQGPKRYNPS